MELVLQKQGILRLTQRGGRGGELNKSGRQTKGLYLDGAQGHLHACEGGNGSATESGPRSKRSLKREERLAMGK